MVRVRLLPLPVSFHVQLPMIPEVNLLQLINALSPMEVTKERIVMDVKPLQ
jgi:hypothetical protein